MKKRADAVLEWIEWYIRANELTVGDSLPYEQEIASASGAGRSSVREAIAALKALGVIVSRRKGGIRIVRDPVLLYLRKYFSGEFPDKQRLAQAMEFRAALERGLAGLVLSNIAAEQLAELDQIVKTCEQTATTLADLYTSEVEFHTLLIRGSGNEIAALLSGILTPLFGSHRRKVRFTRKEVKVWAAEHRELIDALSRRDAPAYFKAISAHTRTYLRTKHPIPIAF